MNKYALIFPGQGSQYSGMGKDLYDNFYAAKKVFDTADKVLERKISQLCFNGSEDDLKQTINSQPCILTVSLAAYEVLKEALGEKIEISATAGHSLGEYAALYASGVLDLETVLKLIDKRAQLMDEAAHKTNGAMAAVLGLKKDEVKKVTEEIEGIYIANYNSPEQTVITGETVAIDENMDKYKTAGAKRVIKLAVSGAFHSPLMKSAGIEFEEYIKKFDFKNADIPVFTDVDAQETLNGEDFRKKLPEQIYSSVMWTQIIENMQQKGINHYIEVGAGKVLSGLNKKINPELKSYNVFDKETLSNVINEITIE